MNCIVYIASPMSGYEKSDMIARAHRVCEIFRESGLTPVSPILEEKVPDTPGKLINSDKERLYGYWQRDKQIIIEEAHIVFIDHAERKSFGCEREYALQRGVLWKPVVIYVAPGTPTSVAEWEDDVIVTSVHEAARIIAENWGTRQKRFKWRVRMLIRTLPKWLYRQLLAWR